MVKKRNNKQFNKTPGAGFSLFSVCETQLKNNILIKTAIRNNTRIIMKTALSWFFFSSFSGSIQNFLMTNTRATEAPNTKRYMIGFNPIILILHAK